MTCLTISLLGSSHLILARWWGVGNMVEGLKKKIQTSIFNLFLHYTKYRLTTLDINTLEVFQQELYLIEYHSRFYDQRKTPYNLNFFRQYKMLITTRVLQLTTYLTASLLSIFKTREKHDLTQLTYFSFISVWRHIQCS